MEAEYLTLLLESMIKNLKVLYPQLEFRTKLVGKYLYLVANTEVMCFTRTSDNGISYNGVKTPFNDPDFMKIAETNWIEILRERFPWLDG